MRNALLLAALGLTSTAVAQIPVPAFGSTFTSTLTRGYWFQAPTNFLITGLSVPNEAAQPFQVVEVIDLGLAPPPAYAATVLGTQLFYSNSTAGGSIIATAIPIVSGNYYGVLGACTPTVGSTTSYNSYAGVAGVYASNILGIPTTLTRFLTQFGIGAGGNQPCSSEAGGTFCRVVVYASPTGGGTIATNTTLGVGCVRSYTSFYENFATSAAFDLAGTSMTMLPNGSGGWVVTNAGAYLPVGSISTPTVLALTDDSAVTQTLTVGTFPGATALTVCSNGFVSLAAGNGTGFTPAVATLLNDPQTAFRSWHDYNPAIVGSGTVKYEESAAAIVVTWDGVWDFAGTTAASANNMQMQFYPTGVVTISWGVMSGLGNGHLVGYSPAGASADPGNTNLSTLGAAPILLGSLDILPLTLIATNRPVQMAGPNNWNLTVSNVPVGPAFGVDLFGLADPGILNLQSLGLGQLNCQLRSTLDVILGPWIAAGANHSYSLTLPGGVPSLVNFHVFTQSAVFPFSIDLTQTITTNGIDGKVGDL